ncbi:hypothetical protein C1Y63_05040 [Corynebacterium sp. 13CS0277]|uniref:hypothetical protein n=1 Tax=Corynebacterium sp. 13CS0277 TaxID=2071994 RepID=UPI000D03C9FC|nr:hypothetical protein [Corynebacterium sp. 13CS0277]PRQ11774.1 hypothetical protein C1Y63_05040 [Corynebacterium sp. 13CS0277]
MADQVITLTSSRQGVLALLQRALRLDRQAAARVRAVALDAGQPDTVDVFVTTPFEVVAARRCGGTAQPDGTVVSALALAEKLAAAGSQAAPMMLSAGGAALWPGALPPLTGFELVDHVPVQVLRDLAEQGAAAAKEAGSVGVPTSLLHQDVLTVEGIALGMGTIWALSQLDFLPPADTPAPGDTARVSRSGPWVRIDTVRGSVYQRAGGPLSLQPLS